MSSDHHDGVEGGFFITGGSGERRTDGGPPRGHATGTVKSWDTDEGWGVISSPDLPSEVWAHFMHIERREGIPGAARRRCCRVRLDRAAAGGQDGYAYRVERVWEV